MIFFGVRCVALRAHCVTVAQSVAQSQLSGFSERVSDLPST
jgi:hypothetical protein